MMTIDKSDFRREEDAFAAHIGQTLRNSADELDAATLSRLNRARQVALDTIDQPVAGTYRRNWWLPVGAAAGIAAVVLVVWQGPAPDPDARSATIMADEVADLELLLDDGDLEMYADLEFFAWLPEDEAEDIG
jgi:ferric-dicitrate binding protein FerR (iron transport regulator)